MQRILVAIDFSDVTDSVISEAVKLKKVFGAQLFIMHTEPPENYIIAEDFTYDYVSNIRRTVEADKKYLMKIRDRLADENIDVECTLVEGPVAETIIEQADECKADLIVIGSHEHGHLYHLVFGSVRDSVLHKSKCPVLVVPLSAIIEPAAE